jgi:hypothetical protein
VLLDSNAALFLVADAFGLPHSELYVEVGDVLVQDITLKLRLNQLVPNRFWVHVQVLLESSGYDYPALKLVSKLSRYG